MKHIYYIIFIIIQNYTNLTVLLAAKQQKYFALLLLHKIHSIILIEKTDEHRKEKAMSKGENGEVLMTEGCIWKHIVKFALPLALGYLFQQLYTTVDSIVVGNYVGKEALAAVGTTSPIINTLIGFFSGLATGSGVVIARSYGAGNAKKVEKAVHTSIAVILAFSVVATVLGVFTVPYMLDMMSTPADVYGEAETYLEIYFAGVASLMIYNMGSAILRAVGDSVRPLWYLICSSVVNVVFDILFVGYMHMGVAGAAYATIISQIISSILVLISLTVSKGMHRLYWKRLRIDPGTFKEIIYIGMPSALQLSITAFSNIFVQSYINAFGSSVMAGWSSYIKIDQFVVIPANSISMSITTFVGQNLGAYKAYRANKGTKISLGIAAAATAVIVAVLVAFAPQAIMLFNREPAVIECGTMLLRVMTPFYIVWSVNMILSGSLCGAGDTRIAMYIKLFSFVIFRQIYLFAVSRMFPNVLFAVAIGYPIGWTLSAVLITIYYIHKNKEITARFSR